jgi:hypothetical protein
MFWENIVTISSVMEGLQYSEYIRSSVSATVSSTNEEFRKKVSGEKKRFVSYLVFFNFERKLFY